MAEGLPVSPESEAPSVDQAIDVHEFEVGDRVQVEEGGFFAQCGNVVENWADDPNMPRVQLKSWPVSLLFSPDSLSKEISLSTVPAPAP